MKNLILLMLVPFFMEGQKDSIYIVKKTDEMSDKVYYFASRKLVISDSAKTKGFTLSPTFDKNLFIDGLIVKIIKIGSCNEKDELIIMFDDSTKIKLISYAGFNCNGDAYYSFSKKDIDKIRSNKIIKARITNGRSYESFTGIIPDFNNDYFQQVIYACDAKKIKIKK